MGDVGDVATMSVIPFARKPAPEEKTVPHGTGPAFCIGCKHEWEAVAPAGVVELQCPACESMKGRFRFLFDTYEGDRVWTCNCGNDLFRVTERGRLCVNCGDYQVFG